MCFFSAPIDASTLSPAGTPGPRHNVTRALPPADPAVARASSRGSEPFAREDLARAESLRPPPPSSPRG